MQREEAKKQGFCKILWRKLRLRGSLLLVLIQFLGGGVGWGGRLFEAGRLLTFSAFRMGANSRLGAYSNKYGSPFVSFQFHDCCFPQTFLTLKKDQLMAVDHIETRTLSFQSQLISIWTYSFFFPLTTECKDDNQNCPAWAAQPNGCKKNLDYMRTSCKKSCNVCRKYHSSPSFPLQCALLSLLLLLFFFFTFFFSVLQFFFSYVCPGVKKYPQLTDELTDYNIIVFLFKTTQRVQRWVNKPRYFHFPNPYQKSAVD